VTKEDLMSRTGSIVVVIAAFVAIAAAGVAYYISRDLLITLATAAVLLVVTVALVVRPRARLHYRGPEPTVAEEQGELG
jgi:hypothetical protein